MSAVLERLEHEALSLSRQERAFLTDRLLTNSVRSHGKGRMK